MLLPLMLTDFIVLSPFILFRTGSIPRINRIQLSASPCFTPLRILYFPALFPFSIISTPWSLYRRSKIFINLMRPSLDRTFLMYQCSRESNAFSASNETSMLFSSFDCSNEYNITFKLSEICLSFI